MYFCLQMLPGFNNFIGLKICTFLPTSPKYRHSAVMSVWFLHQPKSLIPHSIFIKYGNVTLLWVFNCYMGRTQYQKCCQYCRMQVLVSASTDLIPRNLETGPKRVLWVSLKKLFNPRFIKVDVALFFKNGYIEKTIAHSQFLKELLFVPWFLYLLFFSVMTNCQKRY